MNDNKNHLMKETTGRVTDLKDKGLEGVTLVTVEYVVDGEVFIIKESLKLKSETIKIGFLPIGQRKVVSYLCGNSVPGLV